MPAVRRREGCAAKRTKRIRKNPSDIRYECPDPTCAITVSRIYDIKRHLDRHDPSTRHRFPCEVVGCGAGFRQRGNLYAHEREVHDIYRDDDEEEEEDVVETVSSVGAHFGVFPVASTYGNYYNYAPPAFAVNEQHNWAGYLPAYLNNFSSNNTGHIMNSIPQATSYCNTSPAPIGVKEEQSWEGYYHYNNFTTPSMADTLGENALPALSPSSSWDDSDASSSPSWPITPSSASNTNVNIELAPVPSFEYDCVCPQLISPYSLEFNDAPAYPGVEPLSYQDNVYVPQYYANDTLPQGAPLLEGATPQQQNLTYGYNANYNAAAHQLNYAGLYYEPVPDSEPVLDIPAYDAELETGDLFVEPELINFFDFNVDFNYPEPNFNVSSLTNYLSF